MTRISLKSVLDTFIAFVLFSLALSAQANQSSAGFVINGQTAKNHDVQTKATSNLLGGAFHIYVYGFITPDKKSRQLDLWVKNYDEKTGEYQATATYHLRDEDNAEFHYASKPLSVKVKITEFKLTKSGSGLQYATLSGEFQGELQANVTDPQLKKKALAQPLKITSGVFKNVTVAKIN